MVENGPPKEALSVPLGYPHALVLFKAQLV